MLCCFAVDCLSELSEKQKLWATFLHRETLVLCNSCVQAVACISLLCFIFSETSLSCSALKPLNVFLLLLCPQSTSTARVAGVWVRGPARPLPPLFSSLLLSFLLSTRPASGRPGHHADAMADLRRPAVSGIDSRQLGLHHHQSSGLEGSHPEGPQEHPAQHYPHHDRRPGCWTGWGWHTSCPSWNKTGFHWYLFCVAMFTHFSHVTPRPPIVYKL